MNHYTTTTKDSSCIWTMTNTTILTTRTVMIIPGNIYMVTMIWIILMDIPMTIMMVMHSITLRTIRMIIYIIIHIEVIEK